MRDSVLDVFGAGHFEPVALIEVDHRGLRFEHTHAIADRGQRGHQQLARQPVPASVLGGDHATDSRDGFFTLHIGQDSQVSHRNPVFFKPEMTSTRLGVPTVQIGIDALLLDDEDVGPKLQQAIKCRGVEIGKAGGAKHQFHNPLPYGPFDDCWRRLRRAMIRPMIRLPLAGSGIAAVAAVLALAACGPDALPVANNGTSTGQPAATSSPTQGTQARFTPDQVCGLVDVATMSQITGFTIVSTKAEMSGDVSVCHYEDSTTLAKVIVEYQPTGKVAVEFTKASAETVSGLGQAAFWFKTSGQLSVELGGDAVCHVFVLDLRIHSNDAKGGAILIAQKAVPGMPHS